jgi:endonuclease III
MPPGPFGSRSSGLSGSRSSRSSPAPKPTARRTPRPDPARTWARSLVRRRPGLLSFVLEMLAGAYGRPARDPRLEPVSELVLTILSQNTADVNSERAFAALRSAYPSVGPLRTHRVIAADGTERPPEGWGGVGLEAGPAPDWTAVEEAPLPELIEVIRLGGLALQKAPRIQAALRVIRERAGAHDLTFLSDLRPIEARDWLTTIPGVGKKTASIVLLFCFGMPLMPVDTHVERVSRRIGLVPPTAGPDEQHEIYAHLLDPADVHAAHVLLIQHGRRTCDARRPACQRCPVAPRCRHLDPKAP